jgi:hypothetical protein
VEKCSVIYIICSEIDVGAELSNVRSLLNVHSFMGFCFKWKQFVFVKSAAFCNKINIPVNKTVKVKCNLVQALRLFSGCTVHRGSRGIALIFHDQRH